MNQGLDQINQLLKQELQGQKNSSPKKWIWLFVVAGLIILLLTLLTLFFSPPAASQSQTILEKTSVAFEAAASEISSKIFPSFSFDRPTNFLLLGVPGQGNDAPDLTDTIILALAKPDPQTVTLISLPRDLWVKVPQADYYTKINSLYVLGKNAKDADYGLGLIRQKVKEITGQPIDYYALLDLSAVKQIVDELGGLNINVPNDILDTEFPGPDHSYQTFEIKAGWRYFDGATAAKYVRTRHSLAGDFDRIGRQQQILEAIKQKVSGLNPIWDLPSLISVAEKLWVNVKTNLSIPQLLQFWPLAKNIAPEQISNFPIDASPQNGLLIQEQVWLDGIQASILKPKAGIENYSEIQKYITDNQ